MRSKKPHTPTTKQHAQRGYDESELTSHLSANPVVIYSSGPGPDFPVIFISGNIESHFGYKPEDFYKDPHFLENLIHVDDRSVTPEAYAAINAGDVYHCEYRILHKSGRYVWVLDHIGPRFNPSGALVGLTGSWTDITERVEREQALARKEALTRVILDNVPCGVFRSRPDGRIVSANPAMVGMFGYDREDEFLAVPAPQLYWNPEQRAEILKRCTRDGSYTNIEMRMKRRDGTAFWVLLSAFAVIGEAGAIQFLDGTISDVSELRQTKAELEESGARLQLALEVANLGFWEQNFRTGEVVRSRRWAEMLGFSPKEIEDRLDAWLELIHPDDLPQVKKMAALHEANEVPAFDVEHRMRTKSDGWKWIHNWGRIVERDRKGRPIRASGMHLDVSSRREAEETLKEREEMIRAIFESTPDEIFTKDRDLRYVSVNPSMAAFVKLPVNEVIGKRAPDLFGETMGLELEAMNRQVLAGQTVETELSGVNPAPHRFYHMVQVPLRDAKGEIVGLCGIARDITESKTMQNIAARAQRLETAGRIAGQVAHDFNNLLGPLAAYPDFIREELPEGHAALRYVDFIEMAASQMAEINQQLLALGRRGHYNLEILDLNGVVHDAVRQILPVPDELLLDLDLADSLLHVKGGRSQLFRVISNLLSNARDAMADVGRLTIRSENIYADDTCGLIDRIPRGEYVKLTVTDTGTGITPEVVAKMFDPFFTTKKTDSRRGSGLGLSVVHAVVDDHRGYIDCETAPGEGTSIYLFLPTTRETIIDEVSEIEGGTESILVVDDDHLQSEVTASLLSRLGYEVSRAASGLEAVALLKEQPRELLVLDMIMPGGIDGTETYRRIKEIHQDQRAIIVSGYAESERVAEALALGAGHFLRKPLTLRALAAAVRRELDSAGSESADAFEKHR